MYLGRIVEQGHWLRDFRTSPPTPIKGKNTQTLIAAIPRSACARAPLATTVGRTAQPAQSAGGMRVQPALTATASRVPRAVPGRRWKRAPRPSFRCCALTRFAGQAALPLAEQTQQAIEDECRRAAKAAIPSLPVPIGDSFDHASARAIRFARHVNSHACAVLRLMTIRISSLLTGISAAHLPLRCHPHSSPRAGRGPRHRTLYTSSRRPFKQAEGINGGQDRAPTLRRSVLLGHGTCGSGR